MTRRRAGGKRIRAALFLGVGLGMTGFSLVGYGANVFQQLEFDTVDARFDFRGTQDPPPQLVRGRTAGCWSRRHTRSPAAGCHQP